MTKAISERGSARSPLTVLLKLKARREAHALRQQGMSYRQLTAHFKLSRSTIEDWMHRPCPTDEEIAMAEAQLAAEGEGRPSTSFRMVLPAATFERLTKEAVYQGVHKSRIAACALRLYFDALARARGEIEGPLELRGYWL